MGEQTKRFAWTVTVGTKGQIVIPKEARELFHIETGDSLLVLGDAERGIAIPPKEQANTIFARLLEGEAK